MPVQITCNGMEPRHLKRTYGDRFTFWGGGCDTRGISCHAERLIRSGRMYASSSRFGPLVVGSCFSIFTTSWRMLCQRTSAKMFEAVRE